MLPQIKKFKILVDMDAIVVALTEKWLALYNKDHNDTVTIEDLKTWNIYNHVKIGQRMNDYLYSDRFFLDVDPIPGAIEAVRHLMLDHHVYIVSAPSWPGNSASDKISWVKKHMPFFNKRDIFLGHHKHMIKGDILIDDSPDNIRAYRAEWGTQARIMTIAYPYNKPVESLTDVYAESYKQPEQAWFFIREAVARASRNEK